MTAIDCVCISHAMKPVELENNNHVVKTIKSILNKDIITIVAAGNYGPLINTLSPLASIRGVISVGAATKDGLQLAEFSSRGVPGGEIGPTLIAPGVDILVEDYNKNINQFNMDIKVAEEELFKYHGRKVHLSKKESEHLLPVTGTSFAASGLCGLISKLTALRIKLKLSIEPQIIKGIMFNAVRPMPAYKKHEVGLGFISNQVFEDYFEKIDNCIFPYPYWGEQKNLKNLWRETIANKDRVIILLE